MGDRAEGPRPHEKIFFWDFGNFLAIKTLWGPIFGKKTRFLGLFEFGPPQGPAGESKLQLGVEPGIGLIQHCRTLPGPK